MKEKEKKIKLPLVWGCHPLYKIVVRGGVLRDYEIFAKDELRMLLMQATGYTFEVITDENLTWTAEDRYLSIGKTRLASQAGFSVETKELGVSGYAVKTIGNSVFMCGGGMPGTLFSVYGFLKLALGYECYAENEIYFAKKPPYEMEEYDVKEKPAFEYPYVSTTCFAGKGTVHRRVLKSVHPWLMSEKGWHGHNSFLLVPPDKYRKDHPEWYAVDKSGKELHQLNYTECDGYIDIVVEQFIEALKETYKAQNYKDELIYLPFCQEDYREWDESEKSVSEYEKYGTHAAALIKFVNRIAERIEKWVDEKSPGREVYLSTFAYLDTERPPVKFDENGDIVRDENGKAIPIDESVRPRDNVVIRLAPIDSNWYVPFEADENRKTRNHVEGWATIAKVSLWVYSVSFRTMFANLNNFRSIQPIYQYLHKFDIRHFYDEYVSTGRGNPCFRDWRLYQICRLMWDVNVDMDAVEKEFFLHYYRDAAPIMHRYLTEIKKVYDEKWRAVGLNGECNYQLLYIPQLWSKEDLLKWLEYMEKAYELVAPYEMSDYALWYKLRERIAMESVSVRFLLIVLYGTEVYDKERLQAEKDALAADLERFDMYSRHGYSLDQLKKNELGDPPIITP